MPSIANVPRPGNHVPIQVVEDESSVLDLYAQSAHAKDSSSFSPDSNLEDIAPKISSAFLGISQTQLPTQVSPSVARSMAAHPSNGLSRSKSLPSFIRTPEPVEGVQQWWARMISGSVTTSQPVPRRPSNGDYP